MRGLAAAADALAGDDIAAVCRTTARWRDRGQRELPWLAGPCLSALRKVDVAPPKGSDVMLVQRFLVGAETEPAPVAEAVQRCRAQRGDQAPPLPPDARGALVDAVEHFFNTLVAAYGQAHEGARSGHRRDVDQALASWQERLDQAAEEVDDRTQVLLGLRAARSAPTRRRRRHPDRPAFATGFVLIALLTALVVMWLVLQGWPAQPVSFGR